MAVSRVITDLMGRRVWLLDVPWVRGKPGDIGIPSCG